MRCKFCNQDIESDGYHGYVHSETNRYMCGDADDFRSAEPRDSGT